MIGSKGRLVYFMGTINQCETSAKFVMQTLRFIAHNWQSTATLWKRLDKGLAHVRTKSLGWRQMYYRQNYLIRNMTFGMIEPYSTFSQNLKTVGYMSMQ